MNMVVEQEAEDPISSKMSRDVKHETNSDQLTITRGSAGSRVRLPMEAVGAFAAESRKHCLRSQDYAQTDKSSQGKSVFLVS